MLNDNHPDVDWKTRLEQPGEWPDSSILNTETAWQQLHPRLHPATANSGRGWWWVAAISGLVVFSISFYYFNQPGDVAQFVVPAPLSNPSLQLPIEKRTILPSTREPLKQAEKQRRKPEVARRTIITPSAIKVTPYIEKKLAADSVAADIALQPTIQFIKHPVNKQAEPVVAVTAPPKRNLRVVHNNELINGTRHLYPTAANERHPVNTIPLFQRDIYPYPAPSIQSSGINLFKSNHQTPN